MININSIQDAIYDVIFNKTGKEAVLSNQDSPSIDEGHFVYMLNSFRVLNHYQRGFNVDDDGNIIISSDTSFSLQVDYLGNSAIQYCRELRASFELESVMDSFREKGFVHIDSGEIVDLSFLRDKNFNDRARFYSNFRTTDFILDNVGYFDKAQITGNIKNFDKSYNVTINNGGA